VTRSMTRWAFSQLLGVALVLPVAVWTAHSYAGHEADEVTLASMAPYFAFVGFISGLFFIVAAATLALLNVPGRVHLWLGILGAIQACCLYFGGLYVFAFRYPPHWTLFAMESVAAAGSALSLVAAVALVRERNRTAAQQ
jgi:hypothetical protein